MWHVPPFLHGSLSQKLRVPVTVFANSFDKDCGAALTNF
jgi:hypothetical protein